MTSTDIARTKTSLPPSLNIHLFIQTLRYIRQPLQLLSECRMRLGDLFTLNLVGMGTVVMVCAPKDLKVLFTGDPDILHAGEANNSVFGAFLGPGSPQHPSTLQPFDQALHIPRINPAIKLEDPSLRPV